MRQAAVALLERMQRFARIDMRYAATGGFFLSATQVSSAAIGLVLTAAFANLLPIEAYGTYKYLLAVYALLAITALPGIDTAVLQSLSNKFDGALATGIRYKIRWGLIGTFGALLFAGYQFLQGHTTIGYLCVIAGLALPFMESFGLYTSFFNARKAFRPWALTEIIGQIASATTLIATMFFTKNIYAIMIAYFVPYILIRFMVTAWIFKHYTLNTKEDSGLLSYGRSMTLYQIITRAISSADQIVLYHFLGPAQVAIYSLATAVPMRMQGLFRISGTLAFPKFATRAGAEIARSLPRKMLLFAFVVAVSCGTYAMVAPYLFTYVFPAYVPSTLFSQVAVFYTLSAITYPFGAYLTAHKRLRENYVLSITSFVLKIGCLFVFVPMYGIWGAVIGLLATSASTIVLSFYFIYKVRNDASLVPIAADPIDK